MAARKVRTGGCWPGCRFGVADVELFYAHRRWPRTEIPASGGFSLQEKTHLKNRTANATTNSVAPTAAMIRKSSSLAGSFMRFCSTWRLYLPLECVPSRVAARAFPLHLAKAIEAGAFRGNVEGATAWGTARVTARIVAVLGHGLLRRPRHQHHFRGPLLRVRQAASQATVTEACAWGKG